MQNRQQGFTLIELVVVIVILGLLAATALPKFIDVTTDARVSSLQGVAGGLRAAAALGQAQYVVNGVKTANQITVGGGTVDVLCEDATGGACQTEGATAYPGRGGRPDPTATGIGVMMPLPDGYTFTAGANDGATATYQPNNGGSANCQVTYTPSSTGDPVTVTSSGC